jgi:hypothetical protein
MGLGFCPNNKGCPDCEGMGLGFFLNKKWCARIKGCPDGNVSLSTIQQCTSATPILNREMETCLWRRMPTGSLRGARKAEGEKRLLRLPLDKQLEEAHRFSEWCRQQNPPQPYAREHDNPQQLSSTILQIDLLAPMPKSTFTPFFPLDP